ncbi:unnamed protein product [Cylicocyclus nassatus]|uniref:Uncharacterized protein n=1 Tax=Cylicocyclus nassatus TaxID=53992 RepID=A0AA36M6Q3_CYLNA|nr:unnamed protein product [Cylicocyclus nassatus]
MQVRVPTDGFTYRTAPSLNHLPPPLIAPPAFPPLLNAWLNPSVTYTRVTVEDLLGTTAIIVPPVRSQLNTSSIFNPHYHCAPAFAQNVDSCQSATSSRFSSKTVVSQKPPAISFFNRVNTYCGKYPTSSFNEDRYENRSLDTSLVAFTTKRDFLNEENRKCHRDIAKMIWEAEDLYDNALKVIRQRRKQWRRERKRKLPRHNRQQPSSSSSSSSPIHTRVLNHSEDDNFLFEPDVIVNEILAHAQTEVERDDSFDKVPFIHLVKDRTKITIDSLNEENKANVEEDRLDLKNTEQTKQESITMYTFRGKEVTMADIADALFDMEKGLHEGTEYQIKMNKQALRNAVECMQQYIMEELKLVPADFVRVKIPIASCEASINLDGQIIDCKKTCSQGDLDYCMSRKKIKFEKRKYGVLACNDREVTADVIVRAIARLISKIYGRRPPFKIARPELVAFVARKKSRLLKMLKNAKGKVDSSTLKIASHHPKKPCRSIKRRIRPIFLLRKSSNLNALRLKTIKKKEEESSVIDQDTLSKEHENQHCEIAVSSSPTKIGKSVVKCRNLVLGRLERHMFRTTRNPLTPRSLRTASRRMSMIKGSPKKFRQALMRIVSPKKEEEITDEEKSADAVSKNLQRNPLTLADFLSYRGSQATATSSIFVRTVEKKAKKRNKKGWRKSWI